METPLNVILTGTPSDSHTWNLIFLELFLKENSCKVLNLGACVPTKKIRYELERSSADLVVISSINGHLFQDAIEIVDSLAQLDKKHVPPLVAGGKMGISTHATAFQKRKLIKLGYDEVFIEKHPLPHFKKYLINLKNSKSKSILKHAI